MADAHRTTPSRVLTDDDAPRALIAARGVARRLVGAAVGGAVGLALARVVLGPLEPDFDASSRWAAWAAWTLLCLVAWCAALLLGLRLCQAVSRWRPLAFVPFAALAVAAGPAVAAAVEVLPEQSAGLDPFRAWPLLVDAARDAARPGAVPLALSLGAAVPLGLVGVVLAGRPRAPAWALVTLAACGGHLGLAFVSRTTEYLAADLLLGPVRHAAVLGLPCAVAGLVLSRPGGGVIWGRRAGWPLALATVAVAMHGHTVHLVHYLLVHDDMVLGRPATNISSRAGRVRWLGSGTIAGLRTALTGPHPDRAARALAVAGPDAREVLPDLLARAAAGEDRDVARAVCAWAAMRVAPDVEDVVRAVLSLAQAERSSPSVREGLAQALFLHDRPVAGRVLLDGLLSQDSFTRRDTLRWLVNWWALHPEQAENPAALAEGLLRAIASLSLTPAELEALFAPHRTFRLRIAGFELQVDYVRHAHPELAATADQVLACLEALGR